MSVPSVTTEEKINFCRNRCGKGHLTMAGMFTDQTFVVICPCCNQSTPLLPRREAVAVWNERNP